MIIRRSFLVGAGPLSNHETRAGSNKLAIALGGDLIEYSCTENPRNVFESLPEKDCLIQLLGDAAMFRPEGGSWLEALGSWRQPIILKVISTPEGKVPGNAAAYTALCGFFGVPLLGLIQIGGNWDRLQRRLDGLPWLGWLPDTNQAGLSLSNAAITCEDENLEEISFLLQQRFKALRI